MAETIVLEVDSKGAVRGADEATRAMERLFRTADKNLPRMERDIRALERSMAGLGKVGAAKAGAQLEEIRKQYALTHPEVVRYAEALHRRLIPAEEAAASSSKTLAASLRETTLQLAATVVSFEAMRRVIKATAVDTAFMAARQNTLKVALEASARSNDISVRAIRQQEVAIKRMGITTAEARQALLRMITAEIDFTQASKLARLAQDAAVIGNMNSSEAFEHMIYGIQSGQVRVLRTIGINVEFQESYERLAKQLGKTTLELSDHEKVQARVNEVLRVASRFAGIYEAAMTDVGKRMTSLKRYFDEASASVGQQFQPALRLVIDTLTELLKLIEGHPQIGTALTLAATGGLAALGTRILVGGAAAKAVGAVGAGVAGAAAMSAASRTLGETIRGAIGWETEAVARARQSLPVLAAAARAEGLRETAAQVRRAAEAQALRIRTEAWDKYYSALQTEEIVKKRISRADQEAEAAAVAFDIAGYERAMRKRGVLEKELELLQKQKKELEALTEATKKLSEAMATWMTIQHPQVIRPAGMRPWTATPQGLAEGRAAALGTWLEGIGAERGMAEFAAGRLGATAERQTAQLQNLASTMQMVNDEWARGNAQRLSSLNRQQRLHERLIELQTGPGGELEAVERIYSLRIDYAEREFAIHRDRAKYEATLEEAQIERISAVAQLERRRFDALKQSAEGIFDALLTRSESLGRAILNIFKTAILTPIKETFSTMIAGMLMPLYGGRAGGWRGALGFGGGGMGALGALAPIVGGPGGTGGFAGPVGGLGGAGVGGAAYPAGVAGLGARFGLGAGALSTLGIGGAALGMWGAYRMGQAGGLRGAMAPALGAVSGLIGFGALASMYPALIAAGPWGWAAAAGIGAVTGLIGFFRKSAEQKAREKIRAFYGVEVRDKGILQQIVETARQAFGADLDLAIRSPQIRDLIELYAMHTGQPFGIASRMRPSTLFQSGGRLWQEPYYEYGRAISFPGVPTALPGLIGPAPTAGGGTQIVNVEVAGEAVAQVIFQDGRVVKAVAAGMKANVARREVAALQLSPGLITS